MTRRSPSRGSNFGSHIEKNFSRGTVWWLPEVGETVIPIHLPDALREQVGEPATAVQRRGFRGIRIRLQTGIEWTVPVTHLQRVRAK